ncbi:hypothetical protein KV100_12730 [Mumia sp. zg.B21]|uniref:hypothetical protein n=1 Tax=Mumia sp. zg.B21 TaxID=2855447 RepID=UPI001C6E73B4|nr:hypothetical protein [Mumia sp. zg.B21]MBW9210519.1 hypothetical protein [Mumia sp. zg.B21]
MNVGGSKRVIGPLSPPPSAYTEDVVFTHPDGDSELRCTYERNGSMYVGGLLFHRVRAYRFRAEGHCTPWHIEGAYDTLVEVEHSDWVGELLAAEPSEIWGDWKIRHFLIYLDGAGAYEVAAEDVEWLPEGAA